ncbi:MAG: DUF4399 domain-containing protein [Bacteroidia bacterium]|nr:DUF4399 domain-containing protein [Bacteroidia bacterium]
MKNTFIFLLAISFIVACTSPNKSETESEEDSTEAVADGGVFFTNIKNGDTLTSPFLIEMGIEGMQVEPKGEVHEGFGHHHLLINNGFTPEGIVIIADSMNIHYGGGETSDSVSLNPGDYMLTLQFGEGNHVSYGEKWSQTINVTVE